MLKLTKYMFLVVASFFLLVGCANTQAQDEAPGETIVITDSQGTQVEVPVNPQNAVVLDLGTVDSLDYLGVQIAGFPQMIVPKHLEHLKETTADVGGLRSIDTEAIYALQPDVIFISNRQEDLRDELSQIAPVIFVGIDSDDYLGSLANNLRTLGQIFTLEAKVEQVVEELNTRAKQVQEQASESNLTALITMVNETNIGVFGPTSRFGIIHNALGFKAVDETIEDTTHSMQVNSEYILEKNPDVLFVIDRQAAIAGEGTANTVLNNPIINQTSAALNDRIVYLDSYVWYLVAGGITSTHQMIDEVAQVLE